MSNAYALVVRFKIIKGRETEFDAAASEILNAVKAQEPRTLTYAIHTVDDDPTIRIFYELYADEAAFAYHEAQEHTRHFLAAREAFLEATEVTSLRVVVAKGPP